MLTQRFFITARLLPDDSRLASERPSVPCGSTARFMAIGAFQGVVDVFFLKFNLAPVELIRLISELQSCAFLVF